MIVKKVVASITPIIAAWNKSMQEQPGDDFSSVLSAAADEVVQETEETAQPDAVAQNDASQAADSVNKSCSSCNGREGGELKITKTGISSEASDSNNGAYAITFSWYARIAGDVGKVEPQALKLFHDVAERITKVFLDNKGWSGNPIQSLLNGTESALQSGTGQVRSYVGSLLNATNNGLQSLVQMLNGSSSSSSSSSSSLADTAFDTSYLTDIALAKLQYGNSASGSLGKSLSGSNGLGSSSSSIVSELTAKPLPRNRLGGQIVMVSSSSVTASSGATSGSSGNDSSNVSSAEAARRFLEAFKVFVESLKEDLTEESKSDGESDSDAEKSVETAVQTDAAIEDATKDSLQTGDAAVSV